MSTLLVRFYSWAVTVFFGGILLDVAYARLVREALGAPESAALFSRVSDALLLVGALTILAAVGAIVSAWQWSTARNLFIASLLVVSLEFLAPVLFFRFIQNAQDPNLGPWLRIALSGLASILALFGLQRYYAQA